MLKILHTSDWHLGKSLYGQKRYPVFQQFLAWLVELIHQHQIDLLLIAGDIFDTATPTYQAQELYYQFLYQVAVSPCKHVVIIAGNHDSPVLLEAPKALLNILNIHIIGTVSAPYTDEVILLKRGEIAECIVCAVPYLRDSDIRTVEPGESLADKDRKRLEGIQAHYAQVSELAIQQRQKCGLDIPIIVTGHLFVAGSKSLEGDGMRELYVGSLLQVSAAIFPVEVDYVALGHLHTAQRVNHPVAIHYSGAPLAMGFSEAQQEKSVNIVTFNGRTAQVIQHPVPAFQWLAHVQGDWTQIAVQIKTHVATLPVNQVLWLEIIYEGVEVIVDWRERIDSLQLGEKILLLRIKNKAMQALGLTPNLPGETLQDLTLIEVFERRLNTEKIPLAQREMLITAYQEIIQACPEPLP